jgi:acyl dehydratase
VNPLLPSLSVGQAIPPLVLPPITRHALALYCGASGDHNPLHTDIDFAQRAGFQDVIAHGMLSMALLGRMLTDWAPQRCLRSYAVRFVGQAQIGDVITCTGKVAERLNVHGEQRIRLALQAQRQSGDLALIGDAEFAFD